MKKLKKICAWCPNKKQKARIEEIKRQYIHGELTEVEFDDLVEEILENKDFIECLKEWRENHDEKCIIEAKLDYFIINYL